MITPSKAYDILKQAEPKRMILSCVDYKDHWIFAAPTGFHDYNSPFFAVDKKDGSISAFNPMSDFESWSAASRTNSIDIDTLE